MPSARGLDLIRPLEVMPRTTGTVCEVVLYRCDVCSELAMEINHVVVTPCACEYAVMWRRVRTTTASTTKVLKAASRAFQFV